MKIVEKSRCNNIRSSINLPEAEHILQIRESSGYEEQHSRSFHETSGRIRTRALAKKLGLRILDMADGGTNVDMAG